MKEITNEKYLEHQREIKIIKKIVRDLTFYFGAIGSSVFMCIQEDGIIGEILFIASIPVAHKLVDYVFDKHLSNYEETHVIRKRDIN